MPLQARREVSVNNAGAAWGQAVTVMLSTKHQVDVSLTLITFGRAAASFVYSMFKPVFTLWIIPLLREKRDAAAFAHDERVVRMYRFEFEHESLTAAAVIAFHLLFFKKGQPC